jgi:hypothetical protein
MWVHILMVKVCNNSSQSHLDVGYVERHRVYYKGEGGGFPQVRAVVSLVHPCCPWFILAPRVILLCTNHLVWVGCRPVWVSETCQLFLVPSRSSNTPFYPSKCCELGSVPDSALFRYLLLGLTFESLKESGVRHLQSFYRPPPNSKCEKTYQFFFKNETLTEECSFEHPWMQECLQMLRKAIEVPSILLQTYRKWLYRIRYQKNF